MAFSEVHIHALYGTDDGAGTKEEMFAMVDGAYADGSRLLCLTPHFHLGYFGDNRHSTQIAFRCLEEYVSEKYPDLQLILANELRYSPECISWLRDGLCRTFGNTDRVLVDFSENAEARVIEDGLNRLLNAGYTPVLAHVERYRDLWGQREKLRALHKKGICFQMDTQSLLGGFGFRTKRAADVVLTEGLVDFVGSDAHDLHRRPVGLGKAFRAIEKKYGSEYASAVCGTNAQRLLSVNTRKEQEQ